MNSVLDRPTLVLNRSWQPIAVARVARALRLVWNGQAKIIDPVDYQQYSWHDWSRFRPAHGELMLHSVHQTFRVPEVLVLTNYDKVYPVEVAFNRRNLYRRDDNRCQYCGCRPGTEELSIDHIVPRSKGGSTDWENCVLACVNCNRKKGSRSLKDAGLKLLSTPRKPKWRPLFGYAGAPVDSWAKFVSEAYWNVALK